MGAPILNGPFTMPMFRAFVPRKLQPWIYIFFAVSFQLSGGLYLGSLNPMIGSTALMREDLQMCLYANLAGMAIYFPLLFRMKFRFYNKNLLMAAATGVLLCNLAAPHITFLPLKSDRCATERSPFTPPNSGAAAPVWGRSPHSCTGVPWNVTDAITINLNNNAFACPDRQY